jgi:hypothetical protein
VVGLIEPYLLAVVATSRAEDFLEYLDSFL